MGLPHSALTAEIALPVHTKVGIAGHLVLQAGRAGSTRMPVGLLVSFGCCTTICRNALVPSMHTPSRTKNANPQTRIGVCAYCFHRINMPHLR